MIDRNVKIDKNIKMGWYAKINNDVKIDNNVKIEKKNEKNVKIDWLFICSDAGENKFLFYIVC